MANDVVNRFLGGPPLSVAVRLILLCIIIGFILDQLGFDPLNIWSNLAEIAMRIWNRGWSAVLSVGNYFVLGAIIVIPIWLVIRLAKRGRP